MKTEVYEHHGVDVVVNSDMKGKHREICLCYQCGRFRHEGKPQCVIASAVYGNCVRFNLVTPVLECPAFEQGEPYVFKEAGLA
jgi:hypothetical protein